MVTPPPAMPRLHGICDCHTHVFSADTDAYPFSPGRTYTPPSATLDALVAMHDRCGVERVVIVQASPYGHDNTCLTDALDILHRGGRAARGVVVIPRDTPASMLKALHDKGVRGVRVNLETHGESDPEAAAAALRDMADLVAPFGWHVQTYTNLGVLAALDALIRRLPVPLVVDHFGRAQAGQGVHQPGFQALLDMVAAGNVHVKLSAPYRISRLPGYPDAAPIARALIEANPDRMLWGTDWPHPGAAGGGPRPPSEITPCRNEDNERALARLVEWAGDAATVKKILVDNPGKLYGFDH